MNENLNQDEKMKIQSPTRRLNPVMVELLQKLQSGQKIEIVQTVRVGSKLWTTKVKGAFRHLNYLATGITTERVPEDDILVPTLHFTKENGELSSIAIDEKSTIALV